MYAISLHFTLPHPNPRPDAKWKAFPEPFEGGLSTSSAQALPDGERLNLAIASGLFFSEENLSPSPSGAFSTKNYSFLKPDLNVVEKSATTVAREKN